VRTARNINAPFETSSDLHGTSFLEPATLSGLRTGPGAHAPLRRHRRGALRPPRVETEVYLAQNREFESAANPLTGSTTYSALRNVVTTTLTLSRASVVAPFGRPPASGPWFSLIVYPPAILVEIPQAARNATVSAGPRRMR
jgi:hypothetical protein